MWNTIKDYFKKYVWQNILLVVGLTLVLITASFLTLIRQHATAFNLLDRFLEKFSTMFGRNWFPGTRNIPIGTTDDRGFVQQKIEELHVSNDILRDRTKVNVIDNQQIDLPSGLQDKNVDTAINSSIDATITAHNDKVSEETKAVLEQAEATSEAAKQLLDNLKK